MIPVRFHRFLRFLVGGGVNTGVTWVLFLVLAHFFPPSAAYTLTYLFGIGLAYGINSRFIFRVSLGLRTTWRYPFVYLVQYAYGLAAVHVLAERLGLSKEGVIIFISVSSLPITYVMTRMILMPRHH